MKTRKIIASALAFIMATTVAASSAFAAGETVTFSANKVEAVAGGNFSVDISLSDIPATAVQNCEFAVKYDASVLSITDVKAGKITNTGADSAEADISGECPSFFENHSVAGTVNLSFSTGLKDKGYWIAEDGVFATISGTVAAGATAGEYPIEIVAISRDDLSGVNDSIFAGYIDNGKVVEYSTAVKNGAVIVTAQTEITTTVTSGSGTTTTTTTTTSTTTKEPVTDASYGDTNLDKTISMIDLVYLNKYIASAMTFNDQQIANADCFKDGAIDPSDSTALMQRIAGQITDLPVAAD